MSSLLRPFDPQVSPQDRLRIADQIAREHLANGGCYAKAQGQDGWDVTGKNTSWGPKDGFLLCWWNQVILWWLHEMKPGGSLSQFVSSCRLGFIIDVSN